MFIWNLFVIFLTKCFTSQHCQTSEITSSQTVVNMTVQKPTCSSDSCDGASETEDVASRVISYTPQQ